MLIAITTHSPDGDSDGTVGILVSFKGGILVSEGIVSPNTRLIVGFRALPRSLCAPTPLLARGIMRQPQWVQTHTPTPFSVPVVGSVHFPTLTSLMNWWTVSEDRNDMGDLQTNLQWAFLLVNLAFFVKLLKEGGGGIVREVEGEHDGAGGDNRAIAKKVVDCLRALFQ